MAKGHRYKKNPEFNGLEKFVWEYLNQIGRPISEIRKESRQNIVGDKEHQVCNEKPIWHNKSSLDAFVAASLKINMDNYDKDKSKNQFYKATANAIGDLRREGILADWRRGKNRNTGMGVWKLDKTRLRPFVKKQARMEMKNKDFSSHGLECTIFARSKQNVFREELLKEYKKCLFCGFKLEPYMIGAHIVPYSVMQRDEPENTMNPTNGLLLCRLCDIAFEVGNITVKKDLGIIVSDYLQDNRKDMIKSWLDNIAPEIKIKKDMKYRPEPRYLSWKKRLLVSSK